ncbi:MAG: DUF480 domain-containing protein [Gemmatimonadaceae bacterium]
MLPQNLGPVEVRVLGSLIEKELATPDHYPLSLNALVNACNQATNRDPVTSLSESEVMGAVDALRRLGLVRSFQGSGERVPKFQHLLADAEELGRAERAVLGVLLLRGPQTLAEIRTRSARLIGSDDEAVADAALEALIARSPAPAAKRLPRRAGQKELRHVHLLAGDVDEEFVMPSEPERRVEESAPDRIAMLEEEVRELRSEVAELRTQLESFRNQFE